MKHRRLDRVCLALGMAFLCGPAACISRGQTPATQPAAAADQRASRQYGNWVSSRFGGGGCLIDVIPTGDPKRYYLQPDVCGMMRSDDTGSTWHMLHGALPAGRYANQYVRGMLADPRNPDRVIALTGYRYEDRSGVWISEDAGRSWTKTLTVFVNADGDDRAMGRLIRRDPLNPNRILLASHLDGFYESLDSGRTWTKRGLDGVYPCDLLVDRADPRRLWVCAFGQETSVDKQYANTPDGKLKTDPGLFFSPDGGKTWSKRSDERFIELAQDPDNSKCLYAIVGRTRVKRSLDGGETWQNFQQGLIIDDAAANAYCSEAAYQALAVGQHVVLVASTKGTIYRLDNGKNAWIKVERKKIVERDDFWGYTGEHPDKTYGTISFGSATNSIVIDPRDDTHEFLTDWFSVYQTFDAGVTWTNTTEGCENTYVHCLAVDPSNPSRIHLGMGDMGYARSDDHAKSFIGRPNPGITGNIGALAIPRSKPDRVYALGPKAYGWWCGQVFISDDGGGSWRTPAMEGLPRIDQDASHANTLVVNDDHPDEVYLCVSGKVGTTGGLFKSTDAGERWSPFNDGLPQGEELYYPEIALGGNEFALGPDGAMLTLSINQGKLFARNKQSAAWRGIAFPFKGKANDLRADPRTPGRYFVAVLKDSAYRSDDAGKTWKRLGTRPAAQIIVDPARSGRVAVSTDDGVMLSNDAGETWRDLDKSLPQRTNWNMGVFAGNRLVVGSGGSGVFFTDLGD